jgi:monooxygenase
MLIYIQCYLDSKYYLNLIPLNGEAMPPEHADVVIVGAGLSGIGAACRLAAHCPGTTVAVLEARDESGGTWDLFRYPGVRSDSDMFTLGYAFQPWQDVHGIASGSEILTYLRRTATAHGVDKKIRYRHQVTAARWSSRQARWTVQGRRTDTGDSFVMTCRFLHVCTGYYRYDRGHAPEFDGAGCFTGRIVHPQSWPPDLDHEGKRVVVIGSGATAVTLVPALARKAAHVTMLQRSPSYLLARPQTDPLARKLTGILPSQAAYRLVRWKNVLESALFYRLSRRRPARVRAYLREQARRQLPPGFDVDTHFRPRYDPWDQRLCVVPDGDLFTAIRAGNAGVVTGAIAGFTTGGVALASGQELKADIVVTATGLNLLALGGMTLSVDGTPVDPARTVAYKGVMLSGVPNFAVTLGYTNASWTLKADLAARYVCRLIRYMDARGYQQATPLAPPPGEPTAPYIDLTAGYVQRGIGAFPRQGTTHPWRLHQSYPRDLVLLCHMPLRDKGIRFTRAPATGAGRTRQPLAGSAPANR